jgi:hypothetical protein
LFAFHNYCLAYAVGQPDPFGSCAVDEQVVFANAEARAASSGDGLLMDEWGNSTDLTVVQRMAAEADQHKVGWGVWSYEDCCNSAAAIVANGKRAPTARGNLRLSILKALVRAYPRAIAGTPSGWSYDPTSNVFSLSYSTRRVSGGTFGPGAESDIEIPALQYPTGYSVQVSGARVVSAPDANLLRIANQPGADTVKLTVVPARHHPVATGPFTWPTGSSVAPADCPAQTARSVSVRYRGRGKRLRITVYVDGEQVKTLRARHPHRIRLPKGLADGSSVGLVASRRGKRQMATRVIRGCRLVPRRAWRIRAG